MHENSSQCYYNSKPFEQRFRVSDPGVYIQNPTLIFTDLDLTIPNFWGAFLRLKPPTAIYKSTWAFDNSDLLFSASSVALPRLHSCQHPQLYVRIHSFHCSSQHYQANNHYSRLTTRSLRPILVSISNQYPRSPLRPVAALLTILQPWRASPPLTFGLRSLVQPSASLVRLAALPRAFATASSRSAANWAEPRCWVDPFPARLNPPFALPAAQLKIVPYLPPQLVEQWTPDFKTFSFKAHKELKRSPAHKRA